MLLIEIDSHPLRHQKHHLAFSPLKTLGFSNKQTINPLEVI
ncbi:Uncharacterised protein [Klebsiella pneumoniae]|nr:Uncharacterised protein [Klebsiella pneumoniae]